MLSFMDGGVIVEEGTHKRFSIILRKIVLGFLSGFL